MITTPELVQDLIDFSEGLTPTAKVTEEFCKARGIKSTATERAQLALASAYVLNISNDYEN